MRKMRSFVLGAIAASSLAAACSEDDRESIEEEVRSVVSDAADAASEVSSDAVELAARNLAAAQAREEFGNVGYEIDGDLSCTADADEGLSAVAITCTGTTVDGARVEVTGTTDELPGLSVVELDGSFVGTVDGEQVFETARLGG